MKAGKQELLSTELRRAEESYAMARLALEARFWNSAAGELYYTCFHLVQALFVKDEIQAYTHSGVKSLLSFRYIKEGIISEKWGKMMARLFEYRQKGTYGDYNVSEGEVLPLAKEVEEFKKIVLDLLQEAGYKINNES